jgi:HSP20 family molecular chaperone IbpA
MYDRDKRLLVFVNVLLLVLVAVLLVLLGWRAWRAEDDRPVTGAVLVHRLMVECAPAEPVVMRELAVRRVGVRTVSFTQSAGLSNVREGWTIRGVEPQEWARLPASPGMDMAESADGYLLMFSLPGVRDEDIRLTMTGHVMSVQARLRDEQGHQVGGMERRVLLPHTVGDPASFTACYTNGILRVCVTK